MRSTRQHEHVVAGLQKAHGAVSAQELFVELRSADTPVALATVYRQLQAMADAGEVDRLVRTNGESAYRLCAGGHHHHLVCDGCGRVEEVRDCHLEKWASALAKEHGFEHVEHSAEFRGLCAGCA